MPLLYESVKEYNIKYIMTCHLNQDYDENLFTRIRGTGAGSGYDHPIPLTTLYRSRNIILGANPGSVFSNCNTEDHDGTEFLIYRTPKKSGILPSNNINCGASQGNVSLNPVVQVEEKTPVRDSSSRFADSQLIAGQTRQTLQKIQDRVALQYIAGYIARKYKKQFPTFGDFTYKSSNTEGPPDWLQFLSYGGLSRPSDFFLGELQFWLFHYSF